MIEKSITKTYWYSDDGFEFPNKEKCEFYEQSKKLAEAASKMPHIKVPWPADLDKGRIARVYTLRTEADFQFLLKYLSWYKNDMDEVLPPETYPCQYCVVDPETHFPIGFQITKQYFDDLTAFYETIKNYFPQENIE